jgi:Fic family protein
MFNPKYPFALKELPPPISLESHPNINQLFKLTTKAQKEISELKGLLSYIANPEILLNSLYLQESVSSNAVENIHTTIESALEDETKPEKERSSANKEVMNYRDALLAGHKSLEKFGLSSRTIKTVHKNLKVTKGVPGEFRQQQNNISNSRKNGSVEVLYTPPISKDINNLIGNLENFAHKNEDFVSLIKAAIFHYQFEAIHPFEDGNGRAGRILIVLQLVQDKLLQYPILFISGYLNKYEDEYKRLLLEVTTKKRWWEFIEFMIHGFTLQAANTQIALSKLNTARLNLILSLEQDKIKTIKKANIEATVNHIFSNPTTQAKFMEKETGIHWQTCTKYLNYLSETKILKLEKSGRYKFYSNKLSIKALTEKNETA